MSKLSSSKFWVVVHYAGRMHELLLCCKSSHKCHHVAQTMPTWTKIILTCFTKLIDVQPSMAEWMNNVPNKNNVAIMHWNQFCNIFLRFWEIWSQSGFFYIFNSHCILLLITGGCNIKLCNQLLFSNQLQNWSSANHKSCFIISLV